MYYTESARNCTRLITKWFIEHPDYLDPKWDKPLHKDLDQPYKSYTEQDKKNVLDLLKKRIKHPAISEQTGVNISTIRFWKKKWIASHEIEQ